MNHFLNVIPRASQSAKRFHPDTAAKKRTRKQFTKRTLMMSRLLVFITTLLLVVVGTATAVNATSIADVIAAVKKVEETHPTWSWNQTLTSIRKLVYDSSFWNMIIVDSTSIPKLTPSGSVTS